MTTISSSDFLALVDSYGKAYAELKLIPTDTHAGNVLTGASNNTDRVQALTDPQQQIDLLAGAYAAETAAATPYATAASIWSTAVQNLNRHVSGFNTYLAAQGILVSPDFRELVNTILGSNVLSSAYVFTPTATVLASEAVTGSGAGTFTAGTDVSTTDNTGYGGAQVEVHTTSLIGAASIVATLTVTLFDTTSTTRNVTIPSGTASGDTVSVGTSTDRIVACTAITFTGGTSGDAFEVRAIVPRTPAL